MALPPLAIVTPTPNARVRNPVSVVLETTGDMTQLTMGGKNMSSMGGMSMGPSVHLHIVVDGQLLMPAASQLVSAGKDRYRYTFGPLSSGPHSIKVYLGRQRDASPRGPGSHRHLHRRRLAHRAGSSVRARRGMAAAIM